MNQKNINIVLIIIAIGIFLYFILEDLDLTPNRDIPLTTGEQIPYPFTPPIVPEGTPKTPVNSKIQEVIMVIENTVGFPRKYTYDELVKKFQNFTMTDFDSFISLLNKGILNWSNEDRLKFAVLMSKVL